MTRLVRFVNKSYGRRISFYFLPLIAGLSIMVAILSYSIFFKAFRQENEKSAQLLVGQISVNLDYYFRDAKTIVAYLYDNNDVQRAYQYFQTLRFEQKVMLEFSIDEYTKNVNIFKNYLKDVLFVGENGFQRNLPTYYRLADGTRLLDSAWLLPYRNLTERRFYFTAPHKNDYYETGAIPSLVVSAILPVFQEGRRLGYVIGDVDYDLLRGVLDEIYRQNDIDISLVSDSGLLVFSRNPDLVNTRVDPRILAHVDKDQGEFTYDSGPGRQLCVYQKSPVTGWYLLASIPFSAMLRPSTHVSRTVLLLIMPISLLCAIGLTFLLGRRIRQPLAQLVERMERVDFERLEPLSVADDGGEISHLSRKFEEMLARLNHLIVQTYRLELQQKDAQFQTMLSQITPHFMYNALQLIKTEAVVAGNEEVSRIVTSFGNLLRYVGEDTPSLVTVAEECGYIHDYLSIYRRRFGPWFDYSIRIDPRVEKLLVLKLILQPIVENCLIHGLKDRKDGGLISLEAEPDGELIRFTITDNGCGLSEDRKRLIIEQLDQETRTDGRIGLYNVHQRVRIKCGPECGITSISSERGLTVIRLVVKGETAVVARRPD